MSFTLPPLPYDYDALLPVIDEATMRIHHTKHHQTYIDKLNAGLTGSVYMEYTLEGLLRDYKNIPSSLQNIIKNHAGGHHNHSLFWESMRAGGSIMSDNLTQRIEKDFGSVEKMQDMFTATATNHFGSGWAWLVLNTDGQLCIYSLPNQESPLMNGDTPLLGLDLWEHAYYLSYQNKRADYISARWSIVDWDVVGKRLG